MQVAPPDGILRKSLISGASAIYIIPSLGASNRDFIRRNPYDTTIISMYRMDVLHERSGPQREAVA